MITGALFWTHPACAASLIGFGITPPPASLTTAPARRHAPSAIVTRLAASRRCLSPHNDGGSRGSQPYLDAFGLKVKRLHPLRFTNDDVVFYNIQGVMMQLLAEGMPGLYALEAADGTPDSDLLQYSRHEFNTHFLRHAERKTHGVDASDPNWHQDGSRHIDHDHLIVAITEMLDDGSTPVAGATRPLSWR